MTTYKNLNFIIVTLLIIDSMIGLILEINYITYLLCLLNSIILPLTLIISGNKNKVLNSYLNILGIIIYISFSTYNILI